MSLKKLKDIFLNLLSFDSPRARVFNLSFILIFLRIVPTETLASSPVKCVFKYYLFPLIFRGHCPATGIFAGCNCPACGITRGMSRLLRGDFVGAWNFNKMVFVVFAVMIVLIVFNALKLLQKED